MRILSRKKALEILDPIASTEIRAIDLPFIRDEENEWRLPDGITQRKPPTWQIDCIVGLVKEKNQPDKYLVRWANTVEPAAFIPAQLIKDFERKRVEKAYVETEATCAR